VEGQRRQEQEAEEGVNIYILESIYDGSRKK
jgi:hypothetical protein